MKIFKNKIIDVSTRKKAIKAFKALEMFDQKMSVFCYRKLQVGASIHWSKHIAIVPNSEVWDYVTINPDELHHDIIKPSELKRILSKEVLKKGDIVIIEGAKPKKTRWIAAISEISYYGDSELKFVAHEAMSPTLNTHRTNASFAGKFKRRATFSEAIMLSESIKKQSNCTTNKEAKEARIARLYSKSLSTDPLQTFFPQNKFTKVPAFLKGGFHNPLFSIMAAQDLAKGRYLSGSDIGGILANEATHEAFERLLENFSKKLDDAIEEAPIKEPQIGDLCRFWNINERFPKGQRVGILTNKKRDSLMKMSFQENEKQWYEYATPITIEEAQKIFNIKPNK